eukprot:TRINITY_DN2736_c0_g1_i1.p1 TRINITY_DN2736_c0_g1~~TRINITY_DN2736_c0_g1_i1.p1  ORF type:complete len:699 (+),score=59.46 TRINITY_DN2736_c0_g1_i1:435-2531(+)
MDSAEAPEAHAEGGESPVGNAETLSPFEVVVASGMLSIHQRAVDRGSRKVRSAMRALITGRQLPQLRERLLARSPTSLILAGKFEAPVRIPDCVSEVRYGFCLGDSVRDRFPGLTDRCDRLAAEFCCATGELAPLPDTVSSVHGWAPPCAAARGVARLMLTDFVPCSFNPTASPNLNYIVPRDFGLMAKTLRVLDLFGLDARVGSLDALQQLVQVRRFEVRQSVLGYVSHNERRPDHDVQVPFPPAVEHIAIDDVLTCGRRLVVTLPQTTLTASVVVQSGYPGVIAICASLPRGLRELVVSADGVHFTEDLRPWPLALRVLRLQSQDPYPFDVTPLPFSVEHLALSGRTSDGHPTFSNAVLPACLTTLEGTSFALVAPVSWPAALKHMNLTSQRWNSDVDFPASLTDLRLFEVSGGLPPRFPPRLERLVMTDARLSGLDGAMPQAFPPTLRRLCLTRLILLAFVDRCGALPGLPEGLEELHVELNDFCLLDRGRVVEDRRALLTRMLGADAEGSRFTEHVCGTEQPRDGDRRPHPTGPAGRGRSATITIDGLTSAGGACPRPSRCWTWAACIRRSFNGQRSSGASPYPRSAPTTAVCRRCQRASATCVCRALSMDMRSCRAASGILFSGRRTSRSCRICRRLWWCAFTPTKCAQTAFVWCVVGGRRHSRSAASSAEARTESDLPLAHASLLPDVCARL